MSSVKIFFHLIVFQTIMLNSITLFSQKTNISGIVTDKETGERLIGASIYAVYQKSGTTTNEFGYFNISISTDKPAIIVVSYVGYSADTLLAQPGIVLRHDFQLNQKEMLKEVVISADSMNRLENKTEMGVVEIPIQMIKELPAIGGESDVLKAMQLMPGVQSGTEASSGLYVRGGSPDQNLLILDDVPLYYVNHLGGFVSIFNTDALSSIKLTKCGFGARYGNRLSSVIDVRMKDGNLYKHNCNLMVGMVASKLSFEGPLKKDTSSYIISFRRFMYDLLLRPISKIVFNKISAGYTFYDVNLKLNRVLSAKDRIYFSSYFGNDAITLNLRDKTDNTKLVSKNTTGWGNFSASCRWNHIYGTKLFSNTTLYVTRYKYQTLFENYYADESDTSIVKNSFNSGITDLSAKTDFHFFLSHSYKIFFGAQTIYHTFTPGVTHESLSGSYSGDSYFGNYKMNASDNAVFIENEINISKFLSANIGFRYAAYLIEDTTFFSPEPRVLLNIPVKDNASMKISFSKMQQNNHLLSSSGAGMPTDLWLPATKKAVPETSLQYAIGYATTISKYNIEASCELFYKELNNLISYKPGGTVFSSSTDWQERILKDGKGSVKGVELLLNKKSGKITGWIGYTLSRNTRQFEGLNNGQPFVYKYDRTHDISIVVLYKVKENIQVSATWVYNTGNAITLPVATYPGLSNPDNTLHSNEYETIYIYDGINTFRMRDNHRLDVGINISKEKKRGVRTWNFSIYNLYNRKNPYFYYFGKNENDEIVLKQVSAFPFLPSISYSFHFNPW